jgi:hypothetical protein
MEDLSKLMEVCEAASPGPWRLWKSSDAIPHRITAPDGQICDVEHYGFEHVRSNGRALQHANAAFIAQFNPETVKHFLRIAIEAGKAAEALALIRYGDDAAGMRSVAREALADLNLALGERS